jgi:rSAM/selenodomain-associated transferase 1
MNEEPVAIAILAKAPLPGLAKTRLIPALGAQGAARLQARLIARAVASACAAATGPVTLWGAPDPMHPAFEVARARHGIALACQPAGDLGARMLAALAAGPGLVIGTDCPALTSDHLRRAAEALRGGRDAVVLPAEDGGYVLIGTRRSQPALFADMRWSVPEVMEETRRRLRRLGLSWSEPATLWDLDRPEDLARLPSIGAEELLAPDCPST